jgi:3-oxoacyl-[acyl-carrier protein] reductase
MEALKRDDGLAGKVAIISGAASGIGRALAISYAKAGVRVVAGYYPGDPHDVQVTLDEVLAAGGECIAFPLDVRSEAQCDELAATAIREFGRLDIVVAGAGVLRQSSIEEMTPGTICCLWTCPESCASFVPVHGISSRAVR